MPYINRDKAIEALIAEGRNVDSRYLESERIIHESDAIEAISMLSTDDAVMVVRCKNCRYWWTYYNGDHNCLLHSEFRDENGYCSWGKENDVD